MKLLHPKDTMTSEERLQAVTRLQTPDRVPVAPQIYYFAAHYSGIDNASLHEPKVWERAIDKVFFELGPWDAYSPFNFYDQEVLAFVFPMKMLEPGFGLPPQAIRQFLEEEIMLPEDYEWIIRMCKQAPLFSYLRLLMKWSPRIWDHLHPGWRTYATMLRLLGKNILNWRIDFETRWKRRGVTPFYGMGVEGAFDNFSMARGLLPFSKDLRTRPDDIVRAAEALTPGYVFTLKQGAMSFNVKRVEIALHRSSNDFISPDAFRKFSLPSMKAVVERLAQAGITSILHCDGNWDLNFEALRELPAGCVIMQCDGASNIFKAKEVLGDRICLYGDVPADMLALGSPTEVDEYCHRLIEEVGKGGGFILGTGCETAPNAKPENVKAMLGSVTKYGYYEQPNSPAAKTGDEA